MKSNQFVYNLISAIEIVMQHYLTRWSFSGCDTGDEWFPNWDEKAEGAAKETEGRQPSVLILFSRFPILLQYTTRRARNTNKLMRCVCLFVFLQAENKT